MTRWVSIVGMSVLLLTPGVSVGEIGIRFDQGTYRVMVGDTFRVDVVLDGDAGTDGINELWPGGLFATAFRVNYDPQLARIEQGGNSWEFPDSLNDNGLGAPPIIDSIAGNVGVRNGLALDAPDVYRGGDRGRGQSEMWLASFLVTATGTTDADDFELSLVDWKRSARDQVYIDGNGNVLDDQLIFGSAFVDVVIPEPSTFVIGGLVAGGGMLLRRRRLAASYS